MNKVHCVADALSRIETNAIHTNQCPVIDYIDMALEQQTDTELTELKNTSSLKLQSMPVPASGATIVCDASTGVPCPCVPHKFRQTVFDSLHSLAHPGMWSIQKLITTNYVWPNTKHQ